MTTHNCAIYMQEQLCGILLDQKANMKFNKIYIYILPESMRNPSYASMFYLKYLNHPFLCPQSLYKRIINMQYRNECIIKQRLRQHQGKMLDVKTGSGIAIWFSFVKYVQKKRQNRFGHPCKLFNPLQIFVVHETYLRSQLISN